MSRVDLGQQGAPLPWAAPQLYFHRSYAACTGIDLSGEENNADFHVAPEEDLLRLCDIPVFMHYVRILIASPCPRVTYILLRYF